MSEPYPDWWPECPWPEDVWPGDVDEIAKIIPDPMTRTRIAGPLARFGWRQAEREIFERMNEFNPRQRVP